MHRMAHSLNIADLRTATLPLYRVSQVFGLAPFSHSHSSAIQTSWPRLAHSLFTIAMLATGLFLQPKWYFNQEKLSFLRSTANIEVIAWSVIIITKQLFTLKNHREIIEILKGIEEIDKQVSVFGRSRSDHYASLFSKIVLQLLIVFLGMLALSLMSCFSIPLHAMRTVFLMYSSFANEVADLQFINLIVFVGCCFESINDRLSLICPNPRVRSIRRLSILHASVSDLLKEVLAAYSSQILITTTSMFLEVPVSFYDLVWAWHTRHALRIVFFGCWTSYSLVKISFVTGYCASTANQANLTASILLKIKTVKLNAFVKREIRSFSLQLLHTKVRLQTKDLFTIDLKYLHSVIAVTVAYSVVMVQFGIL